MLTIIQSPFITAAQTHKHINEQLEWQELRYVKVIQKPRRIPFSVCNNYVRLFCCTMLAFPLQPSNVPVMLHCCCKTFPCTVWGLVTSGTWLVFMSWLCMVIHGPGKHIHKQNPWVPNTGIYKVWANTQRQKRWPFCWVPSGVWRKFNSNS